MSHDQLIDERADARKVKQWKRCDEIRAILDGHLIFIFDAPHGQEVHYLTEKYFKRKPETMTNRQFVEWKIKEDSRLERIFEGWLSTQNETRPTIQA